MQNKCTKWLNLSAHTVRYNQPLVEYMYTGMQTCMIMWGIQARKNATFVHIQDIAYENYWKWIQRYAYVNTHACKYTHTHTHTCMHAHTCQQKTQS